MINKNDAVIVQRVGNGYEVRPMNGGKEYICIKDIMVFQDKGIATPARDYQDSSATLFGWLDQHFTGGA